MRTVNDRLTTYAILHALETDARNVIRQLNDDDQIGFLLDRASLRDFSVTRASSEDGVDVSEASTYTPSELLDYTDFSDAAKLLHMSFSGAKEPREVTLLCSCIEALVRTRKRIAHSRTLRREDLPRALTALKTLVDATEFRFDELIRTQQMLSERPEYVLTLQIPAPRDERVEENLPTPDYDETGLVGREEDLKKLGKLLRVPHRPVISLVGEGGIGKSAVALEVLNDIVDDPDMPFKAVVWCSLKTHGFGAAGVRQLHNDVVTTLTPLQNFQSALGLTVSEKVDELVEFLSLFPTLLVIDNLETINAGAIRDLVLAIPPTSKLLITSRIGLGELEERYALAPLQRASSVQLLRSLANLLNAKSLVQKNNTELSALCEKLHDVPLALKWISGAVANGASIVEAMRDRGDLLRYCFETIYDVLTLGQRRVLEAFQSIKKPLSGAELQFFLPELANFDEELNRLRMTSMLQTTTDKSTGRSMFNLADAANDFLKKYHSPGTDVYLRFVELEKSLSLSEQLAAQSRNRDYNPLRVYVDPTNKDSVIASIYLKQATEGAKRGDPAASREAVEHAKRLYPESVEAYRISAVLYAQQGEYAKADGDFDIALALAEDQPDPVLYDCIANFYLWQLRSKFIDALGFAERAVEIDPQPDALNTLARARLYLGRYDDVLIACNRILENRDAAKPRAIRVAYSNAAEACRRAAEPYVSHVDKRALDYTRTAFDYLIEAVRFGGYDSQLAMKACATLSEVCREGVTREEWIVEFHALLERVSELPVLFASARKEELVHLADRVVRASRHQSLQRVAARFLESLSGATARDRVVDKGFFAGVVIRHFREKQYGFIRLLNGEQIFFHQSVLEAAIDRTKLLGLPVMVRTAVANGQSRRRALEVRPA